MIGLSFGNTITTDSCPGELMKKRILVVDDESAIRFLYEEELKEAGYKVFTAASGTEALKFLDENKVDLVVTDLKMPETSGLAMIPYLHKYNPKLPILVVTAFPQYEGLLVGEENSVKGFFVKPVKMADLKARIAQIVGRDLPEGIFEA